MSNKVVLITGGAQRLGATIAEAFAHANYTVLFTYNTSTEAAKNLQKKLYKLSKCYSLCIDLFQKNAGKKLMTWAYTYTDSIDCCINNASFMQDNYLSQTNWKELHEQFSIHLFNPMLITQILNRQKNSSHIINIGDTKIITNKSKRAAYLLSKKSLMDMTKMAALEFAPKIKVNAIAPGWVLDPLDSKRSKEEQKKHLRNIPLQKKVSLKDLIDTVFYLENTPVITGQIIHLDGGSHLL